MTDTTSLRAQIIKLLSDTLGCEDIFAQYVDHEEELRLIDHLGADSLDVAELAMHLEDHFDIEIDDSDLFKKRDATVGDVITLVRSRTEATVG